MPTPIPSTSVATFSVANLGNPARTLGDLPAATTAAQLAALLTERFRTVIAAGRRPTLSKPEAAWLVALANHPNAGVELWRAILTKVASITVPATVKRAGFDAFVERLKERTATPGGGAGTYAADGTSTSGPQGPAVGTATTADLVSGGARLDYDRPRPASAYTVDLAAADQLWSRPVPAQSPEDLFSTSVDLGGGNKLKVATHYVAGQPIKVIAYNNAWSVKQKDIARFFAPGEVFICVKHHKPQHPMLGSGGKEDVKFDSTHIEIGVGVEIKEAGGKVKRGAVTLNNPQDYERGLFGAPDYPMIFLKLKFPAGISAKEKAAYIDNIRTWLVIANTFTNFPGNYNGGDPLGTRSVSQVRTLGDQLLKAMAGTAQEKRAATAWLAEADNQVYCAELAHVAVNLGIHCPLNKSGLGARFAAVAAALKSKKFVGDNPNVNAALVDLTTAPADLKPMAERLGVAATEPTPESPFGAGLALRPMTLASMIEEFIKEHVPRNRDQALSPQEAATLAAAQAALYTSAKPGILESLGMGQKPATDPQRQAIEGLMTQIGQVIATPYTDYAELRRNLEPLLKQAAQVTGPRPNGTGAFMPPHAWLLHALGKLDNNGGLMGVEVVGHGLHTSILKPKT